MGSAPNTSSTYQKDAAGLFVPPWPVIHRNEEYDPESFEILLSMQARHFWYLGRHRFLYAALSRAIGRYLPRRTGRLSGIDLGGGCGGWVRYLEERAGGKFAELAFGDFSTLALEMAKPLLPPDVNRCQIDLMHLGWREQWDVVFLLDVLEHIPEDLEAMMQVKRALKPGGLLFVTTPALKAFWSYNDDAAHHVRRYSQTDFYQLAQDAGLECCDCRYFMFFLSPLPWLARQRHPDFSQMNQQEILEFYKHTHDVPVAPLNWLLMVIFACETPLGLWKKFPWGTSVLGVFRRPA